MIDELIRRSEGASFQTYSIGDVIFSVGESPSYYYHISKGDVKLITKDGNDKELLQEIRHAGQSIAEFSMFVYEPYPVNAVAISDCEIIKLSKVDFFSLMDKHAEIATSLLNDMSMIIHTKFLMSDIYLTKDTASKLITLLNFLKRKEIDREPYTFEVPLTRKEIGYLTGLRVETVIRTIKKLEKQELLKIVNRKIFF